MKATLSWKGNEFGCTESKFQCLVTGRALKQYAFILCWGGFYVKCWGGSWAEFLLSTNSKMQDEKKIDLGSELFIRREADWKDSEIFRLSILQSECRSSAEDRTSVACCVCVCVIKKSVSPWNHCLSSHQQENNQLKRTRKEIGMDIEDCWAFGTLHKYNFPSQQEEWHKRQFKSLRVAASMTRGICY